MFDESPHAIMFIGHQYSGKTTYMYENYNTDDYHIVSLDNEIDMILEDFYHPPNLQKHFKTLAPFANLLLEDGFEYALNRRYDIIIDQTNMTYYGRAKKLKRLKDNGYKVHAVVFPILDKDELIGRFNERHERKVPLKIVEEFVNRFDPIKDEEFDSVTYVKEKK